jgi:hypothetical protein
MRHRCQLVCDALTDAPHKYLARICVHQCLWEGCACDGLPPAPSPPLRLCRHSWLCFAVHVPTLQLLWTQCVTVPARSLPPQPLL